MASLLKPFERTSANGDQTGGQEEESTEGEFEAYVDVGEEEGIIEGREGDLILSALEFGNTRVREIMTPRTQVVATSQTTTVSEMRDLIVSRKHSRIPVYRKGLDDIVGVVYVRNLLSYLNAESGDEPVTLLMTPRCSFLRPRRWRTCSGDAKERRAHCHRHQRVRGGQ